MADGPVLDCSAKYLSAMPLPDEGGTQSLARYRGLIDLIDQDTRSTLFIANNDAFSAYAKQLDDNLELEGDTTFANGVKAHVRQEGRLPDLLILEESPSGKKETVNFNSNTGLIERDKVEYCGVSRERHFKEGSEIYRAYGFPGGLLDTDEAGQIRLTRQSEQKKSSE